MLRTLSCLSFLVCLTVAGWSQGMKPPVTGVGILYNRETSFNFKLTTNRGFAPGMEFGRLRTYYKTTYYHISLGELKHPKEKRQSADPSVSRSFRPYVFGKQTNLFVLRGGWGVKRYYSEKAKQKGVAMGVSFAFGPSLGLLKPYYLALRRVGLGGRRDPCRLPASGRCFSPPIPGGGRPGAQSLPPDTLLCGGVCLVAGPFSFLPQGRGWGARAGGCRR